VDADLTDNVSTTVRLLNERPWNGESAGNSRPNANIGLDVGRTSGLTVGTGYWSSSGTSESEISLDLAYVTMKEFLYSPLTLTIGRQLLRFGNGFVIGDPDTNIYAEQTSLSEGDLSARKSFDAVRLTVDYSPLVVDGLYAKLQEDRSNLNDDITLMGLNAAYDLGRNTILEGYFFSKVKGSQASAVYNLDAQAATAYDNPAVGSDNYRGKADKVNTIGLRAINKSVKNLTVDAQYAWQFGTYNPKFDPNARWLAANQQSRAETANRRAWGVQVEATYDLKDIAQVAKYSPAITGNYTYLSGADRDKLGNTSYRGWDPMFEDQTYGHLMNAIIAQTNMHRIALSGNAKLTDDIGLKLDWTMAWFAKRYPEGRLAVLSGIADGTTTARVFRMGKERYIGQEIDATLTYDYTEDVQFSLLGGIFFPSRAINAGHQVDTSVDGGKWPSRAKAAELIGSMKVTF
jgi:hypothetical protein